MCTQEVIWCACGHGEFLPIVKCQQAERTGICYTVLHGNHNIVVPVACSGCSSGLIRLLTHPSAQPKETLAKMNELKDEQQPTYKAVLPGTKEDNAAEEEQKGGLPEELADVVMTDFDNFTLDPELWQYQ